MQSNLSWNHFLPKNNVLHCGNEYISFSRYIFSSFCLPSHPSPTRFASLSTSLAPCLFRAHSPSSSKTPFLNRNPFFLSVDLSWWQPVSCLMCYSPAAKCRLCLFTQPQSFLFFSSRTFSPTIPLGVLMHQIIYKWFSCLSCSISLFLSSVLLPQIFLDANAIRLGNIPLGSAVDPLEGAPAGTTYTKQTVYELCACANGKLYLSPAEKGSTCQTTSNFCLWSWKWEGWPASETYWLTQFEANASQNTESTWIMAWWEANAGFDTTSRWTVIAR